jgi:hypothetical protein
MNNFPHSTFPNIHGLSKEDPNTFLFEFDVVFISFEYMTVAE